MGSILGNFQFYYERVLIHSLIIGLNMSIAWWIIKHSNTINRNIIYKLELNKNQFNKLTVKYGISNREREIIPLICMGKSNIEIAKQLFISIETVKDHNHNIYKKVGVKNRNQLTNLFIDSIKG